MGISSSRGGSSRTQSPESTRLRRPSWRDPRLMVGVLLMLLSISGTVVLVASLDRTTEMLAVRHDIRVGQLLDADDVEPVAVRLGEVNDSYLPAADGLPAGAVSIQLIRRGELVPRSALGKADALNRKPVGLTISDPLPRGTEAGARVDVWVSTPVEGVAGAGFGSPELLLEAAEVAELTVTESVLGATANTLVHVLVEDSALPKLLAALSNDARIAVVLNPGAGS